MQIQIPNQVFKGKALESLSNAYPTSFNGKVPLRVKLTVDTGSDLPDFIKPSIKVYKDECYFVSVNSHGAVAAIVDGELLGLKPHEFTVICWHEQSVNYSQ